MEGRGGGVGSGVAFQVVEATDTNVCVWRGGGQPHHQLGVIRAYLYEFGS